MVTSPDFKKIKAKVGKRAPVKANVTDTSFKAVGLHVSKQVGVTAVTDSALSATTTRRGLTLPQLLLQLKHPTVAVRLAAAKGLKSLVSGVSLTNQLLNTYYPDIIVSLAPVCCIDDDPSVRKAGMQTFQDFIKHLNQGTSNDPSQMRSLFPFVPYLVAIIATGLNSLDIQQRYDGAAMVRWLLETDQFTSESTPSVSVDVMSNAMAVLIPPLTRLLAVAPNRVSVVAGTTTGNEVLSPAWSSCAIPFKTDYHSMVMPAGTMKKSKRNRKRQRYQQHLPSGVITNDCEEKNKILNTSPDVSSPKYSVLMAIYTLFRTAKVLSSINPSPLDQGFDNDVDMMNAFLAPDLEVLPGQLHSSVLFTRKQSMDQVVQYSCIRNPISSLTQFPSWSKLSIDESDDGLCSKGYASRQRDQYKNRRGWTALCAMEVLDLLSKIRDSAIESSQSNECQQLLLCIRSVRLVLDCNGSLWDPSSFSSSDSITTEDLSRRLLKLCLQIGSCIVESYALLDRHSDDIAELSLALLSLAIIVEKLAQKPRFVPSKKSPKQPKFERNDAQVHQWIQLVSSQIHALLCEARDMLDKVLVQEESASFMKVQQPVQLLISEAMLSVLAQLLLRKDLIPHVEQKDQMTNIFCSVFFNVNQSLPDLARSDIGRFAAFFGCQLISANGYCLDHVEQKSERSIILNILICIPTFLSQWRADFLTNTGVCLSVLKCVAYRMDCFDVSNKFVGDFLPKFWIGIESLLCPSTSLNTCSVFEMYPEVLQRRLICLCCMTGKPTASAIKYLAGICARCSTKSVVPNGEMQLTVSTAMSSFIIQCIHGIRRTLSMHSYIAFLLDSTGILRLDCVTVSPGIFITLSRAIDLQLRDISKCLVNCGTTKVMPMLEPLLSNWLNVDRHYFRGGDSIDQLSLVKTRACLCLLAAFSLDLRVMHSTNSSISHLVSTEFMNTLVENLTEITSFGFVSLFESADDPTLHRWVLPILLLFVSEKGLMTRVFGLVISTLNTLDVCAKSRIVDVWSVLFKEPRIQTMLLLDGFTILDLVNTISCTDTESHIPSVARMIAELELVFDVVPKTK